MTPLPTVSPIAHTCDLCGERIPAQTLYAGAIDPDDRPYHAHRACQEIGAPFRANLAALTPSDLCETLQAHPQEEIVRLLTIRETAR